MKAKKIIDLILKTIFYLGLICIILVIIYSAAKLIIEDKSVPWWVKTVSLIFSFSFAYVMVTKNNE